MDLDSNLAARTGSKRIEALLWTIGATAAGAWALVIGQRLALKLQSRPSTMALDAVVLRHSGQSALLFAVALITLVAVAAVVQALRGRALPPRAASVVLVTAMALRAIQLASQGSATVSDAQMLSGLMLLAAVMYFGATRLWWLVLMPLATIAMLAPLVWLEFFKGASHTLLMNAVTAPAIAFALSSILIVTRELRARAESSFIEMERIQARGLNLKKQMHAMETDLKSLLSLISISRSAVLIPAPVVPQMNRAKAPALTVGEALRAESTSGSESGAVSVLESAAVLPAQLEALGEESFVEVPAGPVQTTDFSAEPILPSDASTYEEIDRVAREVLDEARLRVEGKKIRLLLTAPMGSSIPLSVRGEAASVGRWMRALVANCIDSVGGFPDGVVRVTLRPGLASLLISIEDNGRGFNDDLLSKLGASQEGRMSSKDLRREIEDAGGRLDIHARLGVGSRLSIELPRLELKQAERNEQASGNSDPRTLQAFKGIQSPGGFRPSSSNSPRV